MAGKLLLQSSLLPLESVGLARFIVDVKNPQRHYHDPFPGQKLRATTVRELGWKEVDRQNRGSKAGIRLRDFFTFFVDTYTADTVQTQTALAITYTLHQWEETFRDACGLMATRNWLEEAIADGKDVYFIVGYRTFVDATVEEHARTATEREAVPRIPVSVLGSQVGGIIEPSLVRRTTEEGELIRSRGTVGECVYAVHYCKVGFKWWAPSQIDSSTLGRNKWKIYVGIRGGGEPEAEVVEAGLEDPDPWDFDEDNTLSLDGDQLHDT